MVGQEFSIIAGTLSRCIHNNFYVYDDITGVSETCSFGTVILYQRYLRTLTFDEQNMDYHCQIS